MPRPLRALLALALALLAAAAGCSTTVDRSEVAARAAAEADAADADGPAGLRARPGRRRLRTAAHLPRRQRRRRVPAARRGPGGAGARTATVTVTLTNPTGSPADLTGLDVGATADGAELTAHAEESTPEVRLPPGGTARFDLVFPLTPAPVREFVVTVTLTAVDAEGEDVEGSDHAAGASVTFEAAV
ncbi:LEA type 2 family protein [Pseudonocardia alni]|uniref:NDR1/HIN1-like protein n=1 Tax=Pseudonocardia alni TaxID=33907 RepID=UPI00279A7C92|nr:hypothetical protein PaSha_13815 [Pseudonocardia alni]